VSQANFRIAPPARPDLVCEAIGSGEAPRLSILWIGVGSALPKLCCGYAAALI
jgi:hypothetical protein